MLLHNLIYLLLGAATNAEASTNAFRVVTRKDTLASWIGQGGPMMIPIMVGSVVAVAIIVERFLYLRRISTDSNRFMVEIKGILLDNRVNTALQTCINTPGPVASLVRSGIENRDKSKDEIKEAIENASSRELPKLERFLPALGTIAHVSPLLGLLGTVLGMIKSSNVLATEGTSNTLGLIGGISEALITTAAGLIVAIPTLIFYNYFVNKVNNLILEMEIRSTELVDVLTRKGKRASARK